MSTEVTYEPTWGPRVTLTVDDDDGITAILEIDGLEPTRTTTAEERAAGITSLDPPTVTVRAKKTRAKTHRALLDGSFRAVSAAATSTMGKTGGVGVLLMTYLRVTAAVRHALRMAEEEI